MSTLRRNLSSTLRQASKHDAERLRSPPGALENSAHMPCAQGDVDGAIYRMGDVNAEPRGELPWNCTSPTLRRQGGACLPQGAPSYHCGALQPDRESEQPIPISGWAVRPHRMRGRTPGDVTYLDSRLRAIGATKARAGRWRGQRRSGRRHEPMTSPNTGRYVGSAAVLPRDGGCTTPGSHPSGARRHGPEGLQPLVARCGYRWSNSWYSR